MSSCASSLAYAAVGLSSLINDWQTRAFDAIYRPAFHFTPQKNWCNDPNGLIYHNNTFHLYYQYNPYGVDHGHMSWGHATSTDLLQWSEHPVAIYEEDRISIFSGSAVTIDSGDIVAIYTCNDRYSEPNKEWQSQCLAFSSDGGMTYKKHAQNPVLGPLQDPYHFRDPKVIRYQDRWIMAVAKADLKLVYFYSSADLQEWTFESEFGRVGAVGGNWECPDLFQLQTSSGASAWVLIVSLNPGGPSGGVGTQYFIGDFDGHVFVSRYATNEPRWVDYGRDNYAGVTFHDAPAGRRILLGWMADWNWADGRDSNMRHPPTSWRNSMTLPRELGLIEVGSELFLTQQPVAEFNEALAQTYEIALIMTPSSPVFSVLGVELKLIVSQNRVYLGSCSAPVTLHSGELHLRLILDKTSIELRTVDGLRWITLTVFPTLEQLKKPIVYVLRELDVTEVDVAIKLVSHRADGVLDSSYLQGWEGNSNDVRDEYSTRASVHNNKTGHSKWRVVMSEPGVFTIELRGRRKLNDARQVSYLHAWSPLFDDKDRRDDHSTYAAVHEAVCGDTSKWRLIPSGRDEAGHDKYLVQLVSARKDNCKLGPFLNSGEVYPTDYRDENSSRLWVDDRIGAEFIFVRH